jgi:hypothetical protein
MNKIKKEKFSCKRGELNIRGHVWGREQTPQPAVILSHGFLANEGMCHAYAKLLAGLGYIAFTFDFCGGGLMCRSDGESQNMTLLTEKADLHAVIDYVRSLPYVHSEHITLLGCSQGGLVSAMVAKEEGEKIEKLILLYPALCIPDDARAGRMMFFKFDPENIPDLLGKFPMALGGDYARTVIGMDVFSEIDGYRGQTLLLHGTKDKIVDVSYARKAKEFYPQCRYVELVGGEHFFRGKAERTARGYIGDFMRL